MTPCKTRMAPLLFLLMAVSYYPAHAAPASQAPESQAESCPAPPVQLKRNTSLSVHSLPYIDYITYGRLQNIQALNYPNITELYVTAMEIVQTLTLLSGVMATRVNSSSIPPPHVHCYIPERDPMADFNDTERLTEDQRLLANFSGPVQRVMLYEAENFEGNLTQTLHEVWDRVVNLLQGLENVTGVPLPSNVTRPGNSTMVVPTTAPPTNPRQDPANRNTAPGSDYDNDDGDLPDEFQDQLSQRSTPTDCAMMGLRTNFDQLKVVQELRIAVWYLQTDLQEIKCHQNPHNIGHCL